LQLTDLPSTSEQEPWFESEAPDSVAPLGALGVLGTLGVDGALAVSGPELLPPPPESPPPLGPLAARASLIFNTSGAT